MPAKRIAKKKKVTRRAPTPTVRDEVLREAGYQCGNPACHNILTLDLHHMEWVKDGGGREATNLLALCGYCHDQHTAGHIPDSAIRHWKGILHALNHAFSKESMDLLLFLKKEPSSRQMQLSGEGVLKFAGLIAADLVVMYRSILKTSGPLPGSTHNVRLTNRGEALVDAWLKGDEDVYKAALKRPGTT